LFGVSEVFSTIRTDLEFTVDFLPALGAFDLERISAKGA
jgi:hypothetical protein